MHFILDFLKIRSKGTLHREEISYVSPEVSLFFEVREAPIPGSYIVILKVIILLEVGIKFDNQ